jgi:hypothetical protein
MTIQTINLGSYANDGTGDDLRTAFEKVNANFAVLEADVTGAANLGSGTSVFAQKNSTILEFKTLTSTDNSVAITHTATTVNLAATPSIVVDTSPQLGGDLDLQEHRIYNGNADTTVYGYDVPMIAALIELLVASGQIDLDFGTWDAPSSANLDFNGTGNINFIDSASTQLSIDLGTF